MCLNIIRQMFSQNTWTKGSHASKFGGIISSKNNNMLMAHDVNNTFSVL
jgi:hypothetical protein